MLKRVGGCHMSHASREVVTTNTQEVINVNFYEPLDRVNTSTALFNSLKPHHAL